MKKKVWLALLLPLWLVACGDKAEETADAQKTAANPIIELDLLQIAAQDPAHFQTAFERLDKAQQYYFCAAFTMGAMSVAKPITSSAMVNYLLGLGVAQYNRGIDAETYQAFDHGKNIFHYESVVNVILHEQICENIIGQATDFARENKLSTKVLNKRGRLEVRKIVERIQKKK